MRRSLLAGLAALILTAGCGIGEGPPTGADHDENSATPTSAAVEPRNKGGRKPGYEPPPAVPRKVIGGVGESSLGCELPVRFMMTGKWQPHPVREQPAPRRAGATLVCEVDAPSRSGVLRIWIAEQDSDSRSMLRSFATDRRGAGPGERSRPTLSKLVADDVTGWQVSYPRTVGSGERREAAFALPVDDGVLLVSMGPLPTKQYETLLPVYVLAKTTVKVTR